MRRLHTIWILAVVLALGSGFVAPTARMERGCEVQVLLCLSDQQCEQQLSSSRLCIIREEASTPVHSFYKAPESNRFIWPSVYQRPPTSSHLVQL